MRALLSWVELLCMPKQSTLKRLDEWRHSSGLFLFGQGVLANLHISELASKLDRTGEPRIFPPRGKMPMNRTTLWARACAAAIMLSSAVCAQTVTYSYSYAGPALPIFRD